MTQRLDRIMRYGDSTLNRAFGIVLRPLFPSSPKSRERIWTAPNVVSFTRIFFGWWIGSLIGQHAPLWQILLVFGFAAASDKADGVLARGEGISHSGSIIDPCCDKIMIAQCLWPLRSAIWPWLFWMLAVIETALFVIALPALLKPKLDARSTLWGKWKFGLECAAFPALLMRDPSLGNFLFAAAILLAVGSIVSKGRQIFLALMSR